MIDLDATIVAGRSAAGVQLGGPVAAALEDTDMEFTMESQDLGLGAGVTTGYFSESVNLWEREGRIIRIDVTNGYRGATEDGIGIGVTIEFIESLGYVVDTNEQDTSFFCWTIPGFWFDADFRGTAAWGMILAAVAPEMRSCPIFYISADSDEVPWVEMARASEPPPVDLMAEILGVGVDSPFGLLLTEHVTTMYQYAVWHANLSKEIARRVIERVLKKALNLGVHEQLGGRYLEQWLLRETRDAVDDSWAAWSN
jgi:hypothetical protein